MVNISIEKASIGTRLLGLGSQKGDVTIGIEVLNSSAQPDAQSIAQAPVGYIWVNPAPVVGGSLFFTKAVDGSLLKSAPLVAA